MRCCFDDDVAETVETMLELSLLWHSSSLSKCGNRKSAIFSVLNTSNILVGPLSVTARTISRQFSRDATRRLFDAVAPAFLLSCDVLGTSTCSYVYRL